MPEFADETISLVKQAITGDAERETDGHAFDLAPDPVNFDEATLAWVRERVAALPVAERYVIAPAAKVIVPTATPLVNMVPRREWRSTDDAPADVVRWKSVTSFGTGSALSDASNASLPHSVAYSVLTMEGNAEALLLLRRVRAGLSGGDAARLFAEMLYQLKMREEEYALGNLRRAALADAADAEGFRFGAHVAKPSDADGTLTIADLNTLFLDAFARAAADPTVLFVHPSRERQFLQLAGSDAIESVHIVTHLINPATGTAVAVVPHRYCPDDTILAATFTFPFPVAEMGVEVLTVEVAEDYWGALLPVTEDEAIAVVGVRECVTPRFIGGICVLHGIAPAA